MWWLLGVALAGAALYGLHRLALWAEGRDWIYYRRRRIPAGAAGLALLEVTSALQPAAEHVIEETRAQQVCARQDESGEGPAPVGE